MISDKLINEIAGYCFEKKIIFEIDMGSDMNSAHYKLEDNKYVFTISVSNPKDKNLDKIINEGFLKLKNFVEQVGSE
jgi:hypothetical protein